MIELGIRAHDLGRMTAGEIANKAHDFGFSGIQLVISKALSTPADLNRPDLVRQALGPMKIMMLGAYFNPVHPDQNLVQKGISDFKAHLAIAKQLKANCVGSETGSLMGTPWGYHPDNHQPEILDKVIRIFQDLVATAEEVDGVVAVEGAFNHVAYNPEKIRILLDQIHHPRLKVIVDLFNFLHPGNVDQQLSILDECLRLFPEQILIFHLKDFVVEQGRLRQVGLGQGRMKYPEIIARIKRITPNAFLIFEGVTGNDIQPSVDYINQLLSKE